MEDGMCKFLVVKETRADCIVPRKEDCPFRHQFTHGEIRAACWTIRSSGRR